MTTWRSAEPRPVKSHGLPGISRAAWRLPSMLVLIYAALPVFVVIRICELPWGRPVTPRIMQAVCRGCLRILGIGLKQQGIALQRPGAIVSNHASWLDIFTLSASQPACFVARKDVGRWFGIGILAHATGSVFIERDPRQATKQCKDLANRLACGDKLLIFPEGTSTDGMRVVQFKSTLFGAFFEPDIRDRLYIQPVTLRYFSPTGEDPRLYAWWGDMDFVPHLWTILTAPSGGVAKLILHSPEKVETFANRKVLARHCEAVVAQAHSAIT